MVQSCFTGDVKSSTANPDNCNDAVWAKTGLSVAAKESL